MLSAEGDVFDLMAGRYSANKTANFGVYLSGHSGDQIRVDRVGRAPEFVSDPAVTMRLTVQPGVVTGLAQQPGFRNRGLLARFLCSLPASPLGRRDVAPPPVPEEVRRSYHDKVQALHAIPLPKANGYASQPHVLNLAPDGADAGREFARWVEPQLAEFGAMGGMADWGGKLVGAVYRIAGLLHMAE